MKDSRIRPFTLLLITVGCLSASGAWRIAASSARSAARDSAPATHANKIQGDSATLAGEMDEDEYVVISAVINGWDGPERGKPEKPENLLIIKDKTEAWAGFGGDDNPDAFYEELQKSSDELLAETITDFRAKNKQAQRLKSRFDVKVKYVLVSAEEIDGFFKEVDGETNRVMDGWKKFYEKYPKSGGFVNFSRVGFNSDKTQALVYQSHSCGGLCGGGSYLLFTKKSGVWVEKGSVGPVWVS